MPPSRPHHYLFAHRLLPALFHQDAINFVARLQQDGLRFLELCWRRAGENLSQGNTLLADGLGYTLRELPQGWVAVVITLPPPQAITEAYFVALLVQPAAALPTTRVFTLEQGLTSLADTVTATTTILCEWTKSSTHSHRGPILAPDVETFLAAITPLLRK